MPALRADWEHLATQYFAVVLAKRQAKNLITSAIESEQTRRSDLGQRGLTWRESDAIVASCRPQASLLKKNLYSELEQNPERRAAALRELTESVRANLKHLPNPFGPVIRNEPGAREQQRVVWENRDVMVLVDARWHSPKVSVVPKAPMMFLSDAPEATVDALAKTALAVEAAFVKAGSRGSEIWVTPPEKLVTPQLHVHVASRLPETTPFGVYRLISATLAESLQELAD